MIRPPDHPAGPSARPCSAGRPTSCRARAETRDRPDERRRSFGGAACRVAGGAADEFGSRVDGGDDGRVDSGDDCGAADKFGSTAGTAESTAGTTAEPPTGSAAGECGDDEAGHPREGRENDGGPTEPWSLNSGHPCSRRRVRHAQNGLRAPFTACEPDAKRLSVSLSVGFSHGGRASRPGRAIGTASACRSRRTTSRSTGPIHPECPRPCRAASPRADARGERRTAARRRPGGSRGCRPGRRSGRTCQARSAAWWGQELQSRIAFRVTPHVPWGTRRQSLETTSNPAGTFPIMLALRRERNVAKGDGVYSPDHVYRRCTGKLVRGEATTTISYAHMFDAGRDSGCGHGCGRGGGGPAAEWEWV